MGYRFLRTGFRKSGLLKVVLLSGALFASCSGLAVTVGQTVLVRDITTIAGVRDNPLVGYSIVVGLNGTGDRQQTLFTTQTLANVMQRMGVQIPASAVIVKNVAAVFVTASLPPFARPGMALDVTVSSIGDAKSLEGGILLLAPLRGPDGQVYAAAQDRLLWEDFQPVAPATANR
jgi:flagellar P-ring protein precursor FlgI